MERQTFPFAHIQNTGCNRSVDLVSNMLKHRAFFFKACFRKGNSQGLYMEGANLED